MGLLGFFCPGHLFGWGLFGFLGLFRLLVIGGVIVGVVLVVRSVSRVSTTPRESPVEILRRRYANGEISKEEFDQRLKDLG